MTKKPSGGTRRSGFTLVELLVVIGIIALLVGILMPALNKARKSAQAVQCMSNVRQLGIGFMMYVEKSRGYLPWTGNSDGNATSNPVGPWDDSAYWANSVPKTIGRSSYYDLQLAASKGGAPLAKSGDNNVLACPSAGFAQSASTSDTVNPDGTFMMYGNVAGSAPQYVPNTTAGAVVAMPVYWCYVINSKLDNSVKNIAGTFITASGNGFLKLTQLHRPAISVLLVEKVMQSGETTPPTTSAIARGKTTYTRFTARHNKGGHLLMADGHVQWFSWNELQPQNTTGLSAANAAGNLPNKVLWDPFQVPLY